MYMYFPILTELQLIMTNNTSVKSGRKVFPSELTVLSQKSYTTFYLRVFLSFNSYIDIDTSLPEMFLVHQKLLKP